MSWENEPDYNSPMTLGAWVFAIVATIAMTCFVGAVMFGHHFW